MRHVLRMTLVAVLVVVAYYLSSEERWNEALLFMNTYDPTGRAGLVAGLFFLIAFVQSELAARWHEDYRAVELRIVLLEKFAEIDTPENHTKYVRDRLAGIK